MWLAQGFPPGMLRMKGLEAELQMQWVKGSVKEDGQQRVGGNFPQPTLAFGKDCLENGRHSLG